MTKVQKIWLWVGIGLFLIPEILWSPLGNSLYALIYDKPFRSSFLTNSDYGQWKEIVVLIQFLGIVSGYYIVVKNRRYLPKDYSFLIHFVFGILSLLNFFILYFIYATQRASF